MSPSEYLEETRARMTSDGSTVAEAEFPGGPVVIGRQTKHRVQWLGSKINLFTVVACAPEATAERLATLTDDALDYAIHLKGTFRGMGSGVAVIAAVVTDRVSHDARRLAEGQPAKHWSASTFPVVVDLAANVTYSYTGKTLWGAMYVPWLQRRIAATLPPPMAQP